MSFLNIERHLLLLIWADANTLGIGGIFPVEEMLY